MDGPLYGSPLWTGGHPNSVLPQSPEEMCRESPTLSQCQNGIYSYVLSQRANTAFLLLFVVVMFCLVLIAFLKRRACEYTAAIFFGLCFEILGYSARVWSHANQVDPDPFYMQIISLTVGPAFLAAGVYFCMRRMVVCFGPEYSLLSPQNYTRFFIPCDLVSLVLQATGGALAAKAHKARDERALDKGTDVMIAGLAFQVFTMLVFGCLGLTFVWRVTADHKVRVRDDVFLNPNIVAMRGSYGVKTFIWCIVGSTILIFARCCYRVAELSAGWRGDLMKNQTLFIICEGVFILIASIFLTIAHPAVTATMVLDAGGDFGWFCYLGGGDEDIEEGDIALGSLSTHRIQKDLIARNQVVPPPTPPLNRGSIPPVQDLFPQVFSRHEANLGPDAPPTPKSLSDPAAAN